MKAIVYARYSSNHQKESSIDDQIRLCQERAVKEGWQVTRSYKDQAISGASLLLRPGIQQLLQDAMLGDFKIVIAEALDRLSRDQADIANLYKQLQFLDIKLFTLAEGEVNELHVGLKGTMNALFLKDLADKTRRGLRGRIEAGKSGGGKSYGYDVVKKFAEDGTAIKGDRTINIVEATIIKRIFKEYASSKSPRAIAVQLNKEGILSPSGKDWGPSSINGNRERGTGILNNELYIGKLVWNRLRYIKNPNTGLRNSRLNPKEEWITKDVSHLTIVSDELWNAVKDRQNSIHSIRAYDSDVAMVRNRRPVYLFSGLTKCACCGGGYSKISKYLLGCSKARNKGTCDNRQNIRQDELEQRITKAIRDNLMDPTLFADFCDEFTKFTNKKRMMHNVDLERQQKEYKNIDVKLAKYLKAITDGCPAKAIAADMHKLEDRKTELEQIFDSGKSPVTLIHPSMAITYKANLDKIFIQLSNPEQKNEATMAIRSLVDKIILSPNPNYNKADDQSHPMSITLVGDLAGILTVATNAKKPLNKSGLLMSDITTVAHSSLVTADNSTEQVKLVAGGRLVHNLDDGTQQQVKLVAGVGFEPTTFRL